MLSMFQGVGRYGMWTPPLVFVLAPDKGLDRLLIAPRVLTVLPFLTN
jgi:hypothetical protein